NFVQFSKYYLRLAEPDGFYILSNLKSFVKNFFDLFFCRLGSRLTTFKYITRFALTLQVFFQKLF
ncbi:hypothetical protein, partial [Lactobacillus gallinarum]|uniref:hypothetical protein n=1 Tax=Lactobacillus gallinarum TaxID=52242 RepID=UPI00195A6A33